MSTIENPFLNNKTIIQHTDEVNGNVVELDQNNIAKYFSHIYILVKKNNTPINPDFYNWQLSQEVLNEVTSNLLIHKTSVKILKNKTHWDNLIVMSGDQLRQFNIFNYELNTKNIVVPIFNIAYQNLLKYLEQYDSDNTLQSVYNIKVLNKYFGVDDSNYKANENISNVINSMEEPNYWTNYYNCLSNMTNTFKDRNFTFQSSRMSDKNLAQLVKKLFDKKAISETSKDEDYIKDIDIEEKSTSNTKSQKDNYVDLSSTIEKKGFKLYKIGPKSDFTREDINQLFSVLNEKQKFLLFSNLMVSKKYCHLVVNNSHILDIMSSDIKKFAPLFKYLMSYSWIRFYFEECIKKSFVKQSDDFIFDINTASKLPVYPFNHSQPKANPYMPILVADSELKPTENLCGIPEYSDSKGKMFINQGICNLDEFKVRMNIFCTNNPNNNLFDGFDFAECKAAITGSLMTACLQKHHPLMSRFANCDTLTEKFNNYFNEYYAKSDIDVMFIAKDTYTFIDNVKKFYNQIVLNICKFNSPYAEPSHIKLVLNKLGYLFVSEDFINKNINFESTAEKDKITNKLEYVIDNINEEFIKDKFRPYYEKMHIEKYNEMFKDYSEEELESLKKAYPDVFITDGIDFKIYVNKNFKTDKSNTNNKDFTNDSEEKDKSEEKNESEEKDDLEETISTHIKTNELKEIDLVYTYKYKIESAHLNHCFELFPIKYDEFFSVVSRFHLPCVRGYYNGSNVYMTPSCISAHMTYMNLDYKYITGSKDPLDIINKNRMRGFGTWLNSNEKKFFTKYSREVNFWNNLYTIDSKASDESATKSIFGTMSLNHKLFRPRLYNMDNYIDAMYVETSNRYNDSDLPKQLNTDDSITLEIIKKFDSIGFKEFNFDNFTSIDKDGCVIPLKKWIISTVWELYSNDYKSKHINKPEIKVKVENLNENVVKKQSKIGEILNNKKIIKKIATNNEEGW